MPRWAPRYFLLFCPPPPPAQPPGSAPASTCPCYVASLQNAVPHRRARTGMCRPSIAPTMSGVVELRIDTAEGCRICDGSPSELLPYPRAHEDRAKQARLRPEPDGFDSEVSEQRVDQPPFARSAAASAFESAIDLVSAIGCQANQDAALRRSVVTSASGCSPYRSRGDRHLPLG